MQSELEEFQVWSHGNREWRQLKCNCVCVCMYIWDGEPDVGRVCLHWTFAFHEHLPMSWLPRWLGTCWCGAVPQWLWASSFRTSPGRPHPLPAAHQWWILTKRQIRECPWEHDRQCFKSLFYLLMFIWVVHFRCMWRKRRWIQAISFIVTQHFGKRQHFVKLKCSRRKCFWNLE